MMTDARSKSRDREERLAAFSAGPLDFDASKGEAEGPIEVWRPAMDLSGFNIITVVPPAP